MSLPRGENGVFSPIWLLRVIYHLFFFKLNLAFSCHSIKNVLSLIGEIRRAMIVVELAFLYDFLLLTGGWKDSRRGYNRGQDSSEGSGSHSGRGRGHRPPPGLKGREIGLWYARRGKARKEEKELAEV